MITNNQKELAQWAMEYALKNGCQAARLNLYNSSNSYFEIRNMKIDNLQQASENGLSIQLYVDGRYGSISTNRIDKKELEDFIKNGIESIRFLVIDEARTLPDASLYYKGGDADLQLYDSKFLSIQPDDKVALAMAVCDEIMDKDKRVISAGSSYSDGESFNYRIASNGFEGEASGSSFTLFAEASIKGDEDARPSSYWYETSLYYDELIRSGIGKKALERTLSKLGQKKTPSAKIPMIVEFTCSGQLLQPILSAINGTAIQQKNSFMLDKLQQKVFSDKMTLVDDPHQIKSSGARYFDSEGIATKKRNIIEAGVLNMYFIDSYNSNKLKMPITVGSSSILTIPGGTKDAEGLAQSLEKGILVTGFNGGNSNPTTGDFSYGIEGFLIEKGKITQPISEMNITGDMITLWSNLVAVGNDARLTSSHRIPSLLFNNVDFSGM